MTNIIQTVTTIHILFWKQSNLKVLIFTLYVISCYECLVPNFCEKLFLLCSDPWMTCDNHKKNVAESLLSLAI